MDGIQVIDRALLARVLEQARHSPRRRVNYNLHRTPAEDPNRFLNVMLEGTYVAPHRHLTVPKPELFLVLEGRVALFTFDDGGAVTGNYLIGAGTPEAAVGIDIAPGIWHSLAVLSPHAILLEVKPGRYDAATDKQFAPWAPREGDADAADYLVRLVGSVA
ncbi:MAG TPA: WbuC family cupin fold metalloprotein [Bryobacteraceae bacterium]|nr:WbuC family cupin fold metalloprotein [Bryobacteraceae bacterium]